MYFHKGFPPYVVLGSDMEGIWKDTQKNVKNNNSSNNNIQTIYAVYIHIQRQTALAADRHQNLHCIHTF